MTPTSEALETGLWIGGQPASAIVATNCSAAQAQELTQIRDSCAYKLLGLKWQDFCRELTSIRSPAADRIIHRYREFGHAYFNLYALANISPEDYRRIAHRVDPKSIRIGGESVALTEDNRPRIHAHIESVRAHFRAERRRARQPTVQQLRGRLDYLFAESSRQIRSDVPTESQLLAIAQAAALRCTKIARQLRRVAGPFAVGWGEDAA